MSDNLREIADATERILVDLLPGDEAESWDTHTWTALAEAGLAHIAVTESAGGGGGSLREAAEVVRVAGAFALRAPLAETSLLATWLSGAAGLAIPTGTLSVATGPDDIRATRGTTGGWTLDGTARRVPYGRFAAAVVLVAVTEQGPLAVIADPAAAKVAEVENLAGDSVDDIDVSGLTVDPDRAAAIADDIVQELGVRLALTRLLLCSGAASQVLSMTVRYTGEREQFGRPIARFQAVQQLVAELAGEVAALQIGVDAALLALASGSSLAWLAVASAKTDAERSIARLTTIAHQVHGAMGATQEHALHRFTTRLWSWREEGGSATRWADAIAGRMLAPQAASLWEQVVGD